MIVNPDVVVYKTKTRNHRKTLRKTHKDNFNIGYCTLGVFDESIILQKHGCRRKLKPVSTG